jgi:hypothetical protein
MKYGSTSRMMALVFHAILFAAFGVLGLYFGFFVAPEYFDPAIQTYFTNGATFGAYNLYLELAVIGLAIATVSGYGLVEGVKAVLAPNDDAPVIKSFTAFIGDGYIASAFFLLQGMLFFDLTANKNLPFVIIMAILITIILLIATNIPMVKLFDGKDQKPLVVGLSLSGAVTFFWIAAEVLLTLIVSQGYVARNGAYTGSSWIHTQLLIGGLASLAIMGLLLGAAIVTLKKGTQDKGAAALSGYLTSGAVALLGGEMLALGIIEVVNYSTEKIHMESSTLSAATYGYGYGIMLLILGSAALLAAIYFAAVTGKEAGKKPVAKA